MAPQGAAAPRLGTTGIGQKNLQFKTLTTFAFTESDKVYTNKTLFNVHKIASQSLIF